MKTITMKTLTLNRSWFITNSDGCDEFDYILYELGIGKNDDERSGIDEIEITVDGGWRITDGELDLNEGGE